MSSCKWSTGKVLSSSCWPTMVLQQKRFQMIDIMWSYLVRKCLCTGEIGLQNRFFFYYYYLNLLYSNLSLPHPLCLSQSTFLWPAGPDGGWTSCLSPHLRGGGVRQLGSAAPALLSARTHSAPHGPGGSSVSGVVSQPSVRWQLQPPPVLPKPRQPTASSLRGGAAITTRRQDQWWRRAASSCQWRQRHLINRLSGSTQTTPLTQGLQLPTVDSTIWLTVEAL